MTARGTVTQHHEDRIRQARAARDRAEQAYHDAIRDAAADGGSVRELAKVAGVAPNTIVKILSN